MVKYCALEVFLLPTFSFLTINEQVVAVGWQKLIDWLFCRRAPRSARSSRW